MVKLFPSLIASNPLTLEKTLFNLRDACNGFHLDIMDNIFVSHLAFSLETVNAIRQATSLPLWIHLMVVDPLKYVTKLAVHEHDIVSIHYESASVEDLKTVFNLLKSKNVIASCALQPETPISVLHELIGYIDHVLIMAVKPGFSGQDFLPYTVKKLKDYALFQREYDAHLGVGVDGGINLATIQEILPYSVTDIALGASVFFGNNPEEKLQQFFKIL